MDVIDMAQKSEAQWHRSNQSRHELSVQSGLISAESCVDCGAPIPEARRQAVPGCTRCASCQEVADAA